MLAYQDWHAKGDVMKTIVMGKQKGGIGATTLVRELAVAAAADGLRVVVIDLDPQHTLSKWWNRRTAGAEGVAGIGTGAGDLRSDTSARCTRPLLANSSITVTMAP